jgi:hypothetical protein
MQIDDAISIAFTPDLGVAPGNLGVLEPDGVRAVPAQSQRTGRELETFTLVRPLDHGQGGHEAYLLSSDAGHERSMLRLFPRLTHRSMTVNPPEAAGEGPFHFRVPTQKGG